MSTNQTLAYVKYKCLCKIEAGDCKENHCFTCPTHKYFMEIYEELSSSDKLEVTGVFEELKSRHQITKQFNDYMYTPKRTVDALMIKLIFFLFIVPVILWKIVDFLF